MWIVPVEDFIELDKNKFYGENKTILFIPWAESLEKTVAVIVNFLSKSFHSMFQTTSYRLDVKLNNNFNLNTLSERAAVNCEQFKLYEVRSKSKLNFKI